MKSISFSQARPQDIDLIMAMETDGFAAANREAREVFAARIETFPHGSLIAQLGPQRIGCIFCEIWPASPTPVVEHFALGHDIRARHSPALGSELYVSSLTLRPEFRGRGLGKQLLLGAIDECVKAFPQLTSALLLVNEGWRQARAIYAGAGFEEVARFADFFGADATRCADGLVMRRALTAYPALQ